jgi:acetyltransferase-like isoleucine patch superfamily enzyme
MNVVSREARKGSLLRRVLVDCWNVPFSMARRATLAIRFFGRRITIHPSSEISMRSVIRTDGGGSISIGKNCEIHPFAMVLTYGGDIHIGDNCSVNPFAIVYGHGGVRIGNGVRIAAHTVIIPANHNPPSEGVPLHMSGTRGKGIVIDDDVWLGTGARILDGVHISRHAIVGAGSVVTKSVPENATVAGVPALLIKQR